MLNADFTDKVTFFLTQAGKLSYGEQRNYLKNKYLYEPSRLIPLSNTGERVLNLQFL